MRSERSGIMKCPVCVNEGLKSKVYPHFGFVAAAYYPPFYDEEGRLHNHDANVSATDYECSHGHQWTETTRGSCWCGWSGGEATIAVKEPEIQKGA